jgi:hypothetical protein
MTEPPETPKQPYTAPVLLVYGSLVEVTRSGPIGGKNDKGSGSKTRTN